MLYLLPYSCFCLVVFIFLPAVKLAGASQKTQASTKNIEMTNVNGNNDQATIGNKGNGGSAAPLVVPETPAENGMIAAEGVVDNNKANDDSDVVEVIDLT